MTRTAEQIHGEIQELVERRREAETLEQRNELTDAIVALKHEAAELRKAKAAEPKKIITIMRPNGEIDQQEEGEDLDSDVHRILGSYSVRFIKMDNGECMWVDEQGAGRRLWPNKAATEYLHHKSKRYRERNEQVFGAAIISGQARPETIGKKMV